MKQIKKISIILICICCLSVSTVKAIEVPEEKYVTFYGKKVYQGVTYNGEAMPITIAVCSYSRNTFPIYALTREKHSLNDTNAYSTKVNETVKNEKVKQILLQGYPNYTFQELGCSSDDEAYLITQLAIFDVYYNYDLTKFSVTQENKYTNIISNMITFIEKMRNLEEKTSVIDLTIDEKTYKWQQEVNEYESKTYELLGNTEVENFTIDIKTENEDDKKKILIKNENNETQNSFENGEKFKILIPKKENIEFEIIVTAEIKANSVRKGNGPSELWESYIFLGNTEKVNTNLVQTHYKIEEAIDEELSQEDDKNTDEEELETLNNYLHFSKKQDVKKLPQTGF